MSAVLHPKFKLKLLSEGARLHMKQHVLTYVQEVSDENYDYRDSVPVSCEASTSANANEDEDDLHNFMSSIRKMKQQVYSTLSRELKDFLESKSASIHSLADYSVMERTSVKVNSTLRAVLHRRYYRNDRYSAKCKMSDELFDKMVFFNCRSLS